MKPVGLGKQTLRQPGIQEHASPCCCRQPLRPRSLRRMPPPSLGFSGGSREPVPRKLAQVLTQQCRPPIYTKLRTF